MKNSIKTFALIVFSALLLVGCKSNGKSNIPTLDDVSFHESEEEEDPYPGSIDLPNVGDQAIEALSLDIHPTYFNNADLHNISGQWSGYGIHHPSIFKYKGTYYLYISTPSANVGIRAYRSTDLINWEYITESGLSMGYIAKDRFTLGANSPHVLRFEDKFYLYFKGNTGYKIYVSDSPEGPFTSYADLNFDSLYESRIYQAPNGKLFLISGGENYASIYEMKSLSEVDLNSREIIKSTISDTYFGDNIEVNLPNISYINGVCYLTYSSQKDNFKSYRSYLISAVKPDFTSSKSLADSFFNQKISPLLINADEDYGAIGLGDVSFIEGVDSVNYFALYTSYENSSTRRVNLAPVQFSGANISISHRDEDVLYPLEDVKVLHKDYDDLVLGEDIIEGDFTATYSFKDLDTIYFAYNTKNNNYQVSFMDNKATLIKMENGLKNELVSFSCFGHNHEVKVEYNDKLEVFVDGKELFNKEVGSLKGRIAYLDKTDAVVDLVQYCLSHSYSAMRNNLTTAEAPSYALSYFDNKSSISNLEKLKMVTDLDNDFYGSYYLNMSGHKDYARFLVDVPSNGRYGVELVLNASFTNHSSALGIRAGLNSEVIYQTTPLGEVGFARTLTAEFNLSKGANEVLVENLSLDILRLMSIRLVKVSSFNPSYTLPLDNYATKGVKYLTDFRINENYHCHETYEGARSFAYVGDNTFTDFKISTDVAFLGGTSTTGFVSIGFRCTNYVSSSIDNDESMTGYFLEISQYQTKLMKHNYGYGQTLGVLDFANQIGEFKTYVINITGNKIQIYCDDYLMLTIIDQYAFTSGRLSFGSKNTNGLIKNFTVSPAE